MGWFIDTLHKICKGYNENAVKGGLMGNSTADSYNAGFLQNSTDIQIDFIASSIDFMKEWKDAKLDEEEMRRNDKLKQLGFTSSRTMEISNKKQSVGLQAACFQWFEDNFPGCFFLRTEDFVFFLSKYNLVCGYLREYKGYISPEYIDKIYDTGKTLKAVESSNQYSNRKDENCFYDKIIGIVPLDVYEKVMSQPVAVLLRFPFDSEFTKSIKSNHGVGVYTISTTSCELFIAAPSKDMNQIVEIRDNNCLSEGAFIFQLTPYGVVIFHKLGDASENDKQ